MRTSLSGVLLALSLVASVPACFAAEPAANAPAANAPMAPTAMNDILATLKPTHPRLLASATTWDELKARRLHDPILDAFLKRGELDAKALLDVPPIPYHKDGKRLLHVSRGVLRRVILLAMQYQLTGNQAFAKRAEQEMLNVSGFGDWNPSHFLDVGELSVALALGYDWLYDEMSPETRQTIRTAIVEKGLKPGLVKQGWETAQSNWNQVCYTGLSLGALAIAEDEPTVASQILQAAKQNNHFGLEPYKPDGLYPEGPMYWGYGTTFEAVLLDALQSALGTDWGLSQSQGFLQSADALFQIIGPTGAYFNFSDGVERPSLEGGNFWFAHFLKRPELVRFEADNLKKYSDLTRITDPTTEDYRLFPLVALWWPQTPNPNAPVPPTEWYGKGVTPQASFRSSWSDPDALFLALKGGQASHSHAHMDAGSFVFEADGVRWGRDLGMQNYLSLESKGVDLWNSAQNAGRWTVYRLNNFSHSTLTINNQLHRVDGMARITNFGTGDNAGAIVDLSPVFKGQATRVTRGFAFRPNSHVLIRDELEGLKAGDTVRWAMLTGSRITIAPDGQSATLSENGKTLNVLLRSAGVAKFEAISAQPPQNNYDDPNPNRQLLIVNFTAPETGNLNWSVILQPGSKAGAAIADNLENTELKDWPMPVTK